MNIPTEQEFLSSMNASPFQVYGPNDYKEFIDAIDGANEAVISGSPFFRRGPSYAGCQYQIPEWGVWVTPDKIHSVWGRWGHGPIIGKAVYEDYYG